MNEKVELRTHQAQVCALPCSERSRGNGTPGTLRRDMIDRCAKILIEFQLGVERRLPVVPQSRVRVSERGAVSVAAEVGGSDRVFIKMEDEIPVTQLGESSWQDRWRWRRGNWRNAWCARFDVPENTEACGSDRCALNERTAIHVSVARVDSSIQIARAEHVHMMTFVSRHDERKSAHRNLRSVGRAASIECRLIEVCQKVNC